VSAHERARALLQFLWLYDAETYRSKLSDPEQIRKLDAFKTEAMLAVIGSAPNTFDSPAEDTLCA